ncbi:hypothetical protein C8J57DRAFT_1233033 [Mycena rebaudengoi]|nr:hypothetical protein C8J57DRAFT_1233033 [Mycena rebaudengoi]
MLDPREGAPRESTPARRTLALILKKGAPQRTSVPQIHPALVTPVGQRTPQHRMPQAHAHARHADTAGEELYFPQRPAFYTSVHSPESIALLPKKERGGIGIARGEQQEKKARVKKEKKEAKSKRE